MEIRIFRCDKCKVEVGKTDALYYPPDDWATVEIKAKHKVPNEGTKENRVSVLLCPDCKEKLGIPKLPSRQQPISPTLAEQLMDILYQITERAN
jgi:uncharacterized protein YlaI